MDFATFDPNDAGHINALTALWNAACGPDLAMTERGVTFNTRPVTGGMQAGRFALVAGRPAACVLASALPGDAQAADTYMEREDGFVDALVVSPEQQGKGLGTALLAWAETWLLQQGSRRARLGASLRPFVPGLPTQLNTTAFFAGRGYEDRQNYVWDVAADLAEYRSPTARQAAPCSVAAAGPGEAAGLLAFLQREFPARWRFEFEESRRNGGRLSDYLLLVTERGVDGFAHTTWEDSYWPLDRVHPQRLPRPWAQLGPLGVSRDLRGSGYGFALMDGALRHLSAAGIRGCVIDWTHLVDFYARFGFAQYTRYVMLEKVIS